MLPENTITLSYVQVALLVGMGLQFKTIDQLQGELKLQANQLLPVFNKAIRKFTRLFRGVYQREIERAMADEETKDSVKLGALLSSVKDNKQAIVEDVTLKQSLAQELSGQGAGTKMAAELSKEKHSFLARHKIKDHQQELLANVKLVGSQTVVSVPRKRDREEADDQEEPLLPKKEKGNKRHKGK